MQCQPKRLTLDSLQPGLGRAFLAESPNPVQCSMLLTGFAVVTLQFVFGWMIFAMAEPVVFKQRVDEEDFMPPL